MKLVARSLLLFALVFIPLWWRFSGRWLGHLQARIAANHAKPVLVFPACGILD